MPQTSAPDRKVPTRRISFDESLADLPKHFAAGGDLILSHLAASLSSVFPDGEDFFVRSVRHYRDRITDPDLRRQVAGFIGQEATHGREHRALNDRLDQLGYPTKFFERLTRRALGMRERVAPPIANLAATAALEHFTATFAELVLSSDDTRALFGHDEIRNLFLWHALEEAEHKAVAFDVYKAMGGGERLRTWTMTAPHRRVHRRHRVPGLRGPGPGRLDVPTGGAAGELAAVPAVADHAGAPLATPARLQPSRLPPRRPRHDRAGRALAGRAVRPRGHAQRQAGDRRRLKEPDPTVTTSVSEDLAAGGDPPVEHLDVLVVGAGLSGVGAGLHLQASCPWARYAIFEARDAIGGTWDLFRYPGIRSDSDMFTLGYSLRPWTGRESIADGASILRYIRDTAAESGVDAHIRYHHRIVRADWSTADARWTVTAERTDTGETVQVTAGFLFSCSGYYRYDQGYTPEFAGRDRFRGTVVHPQAWPDDLDHTDKRIVVIGSGATAITLIPALAETAAHVTMLQRSPTYVASLPGTNPATGVLHRVLPKRWADTASRWMFALGTQAFYQLSQRRPPW